MPRVSIITALHNKGPYIAETIHSVIAQTILDWEMIVVENGSTDNGPEIVRGVKDPRIQLIVSEKLGPGAARNHGLQQASGEWVLFLDADDLLAPNYLAERLGLVEGIPAANILAGFWEEFQDGERQKLKICRPATFGIPSRAVEEISIAYPPWILHAALIRRSWLKSLKPWSEDFDRVQSEDAVFWFRVLQDATLAWGEASGAIYRLSTPSSRDAVRDIKIRFESVCRVVQSNLDFLRQQGREPTLVQRSVLVRVFEQEYLQLLACGLNVIADEALRQAESYLAGPGWWFSPGMLARKWMGIRKINQLRHSMRRD